MSLDFIFVLEIIPIHFTAKCIKYLFNIEQFRIRETLNLLTCADSFTISMNFFWYIYIYFFFKEGKGYYKGM